MAILSFLNGIFLKIVGFFLSAILVWSVPASSGAAIEPKDQANLKLQASLLSDVHMQSFEYSGYQELAKGLRGIANSKARQDALVFVGDNTMNGQGFEYLMFYGLLSHYNPVGAKNTLVAMGNHDYAASSTVQKAIDRHNFFLRSYNGAANDKAYYSQVINGYTFLVLGGDDAQDEYTFTAAQAAWLGGAMAAAAPGKPVFVFCHYSLYKSDANDAALLAVLEQYPNVFLFNGHWHTPLDARDDNGITRVNLPALHGRHSDGRGVGEGVQLEVYGDRVILRGRNYMTGEWGEAFEIALT